MREPIPYDISEGQPESTEGIDQLAQSLAESISAEGEPPELTLTPSTMSDNPNVIDGTPDSFTSKTAADERAEARIERPMQDKLSATENMDDLKRKCSDAIADLTQYEIDRSEVNAEMQAIRERLAALGIGKKALAAAITYAKMNEKNRDGFDLAYGILRDVIGEPIQSDLFADMPADTSTGD